MHEKGMLNRDDSSMKHVYSPVDGEEKTTEFFTEEDIITPACTSDNSSSKYNIACLEDSVLLVSNPALEARGFSKFPQFEK